MHMFCGFVFDSTLLDSKSYLTDMCDFFRIGLKKKSRNPRHAGSFCDWKFYRWESSCVWAHGIQFDWIRCVRTSEEWKVSMNDCTNPSESMHEPSGKSMGKYVWTQRGSLESMNEPIGEKPIGEVCTNPWERVYEPILKSVRTHGMNPLGKSTGKDGWTHWEVCTNMGKNVSTHRWSLYKPEPIRKYVWTHRGSLYEPMGRTQWGSLLESRFAQLAALLPWSAAESDIFITFHLYSIVSHSIFMNHVRTFHHHLRHTFHCMQRIFMAYAFPVCCCVSETKYMCRRVTFHRLERWNVLHRVLGAHLLCFHSFCNPLEQCPYFWMVRRLNMDHNKLKGNTEELEMELRARRGQFSDLTIPTKSGKLGNFFLVVIALLDFHCYYYFKMCSANPFVGSHKCISSNRSFLCGLFSTLHSETAVQSMCLLFRHISWTAVTECLRMDCFLEYNLFIMSMNVKILN